MRSTGQAMIILAHDENALQGKSVPHWRSRRMRRLPQWSRLWLTKLRLRDFSTVSSFSFSDLSSSSSCPFPLALFRLSDILLLLSYFFSCSISFWSSYLVIIIFFLKIHIELSLVCFVWSISHYIDYLTKGAVSTCSKVVLGEYK